MLKYLLKDKINLIFCLILIIFYSCAVFAFFVAPYHYDDEFRQHSYAPPTKIHFWDHQGNFHFRPFIYAYESRYSEFRQKIFFETYEKIYPIHLFSKGRLMGVEKPGRLYLLGADRYGRDIFSRIIYGARVSLFIGWLGALITFTLGMIIGGIAGYYGGKLDACLMRFCEILMMIPSFYLMLSLRMIFPVQMGSLAVFCMIIVILSLVGWASLARVIRGQVLSLREREFVLAAVAFGKKPFYIITRHLLGHTLGFVSVALTMTIPSYILGESALSLIGLGIQEPIPSWGNLLSDAMNISQLMLHPWILWPGIFILLTIMAFNQLGDQMRDALDPKHQTFHSL